MSILGHLFKLRDNANKAKNPGDEEKPFLEHLDDLRRMIMKIVITLLVTTTLAFVFNKQLLDIVNYPLASADIPEVARKATSVIKPTEAFTVTLKICFYAGIIASFPLLLLFIGEFVFPGLNEKEKKLIVPTLLAGSLLFVGGVLFAYYGVNRRALEFFYHFGRNWGIESDLRFQYHVGFITQLTLVFGLCFELPVVVMAFVKLELLSYRLDEGHPLLRHRHHLHRLRPHHADDRRLHPLPPRRPHDRPLRDLHLDGLRDREKPANAPRRPSWPPTASASPASPQNASRRREIRRP